MPKITKGQAWAKRNDEAFIEITDRSQFLFTRNWFRYRNQVTWSTFLPTKYKDYDRVKMLQIGVFEGQDLIWCLQNILNKPGSLAIAVDPWAPTTKLSESTMLAVKQRAAHNLAIYQDKVITRSMTSDSWFSSKETTDPFDLVVVDGDHEAEPAYRDAVNSLPLCARGAWIIFDDVRNRVTKNNHVQDAVLRFENDYKDNVRLVWQHRFCDCYEVL